MTSPSLLSHITMNEGDTKVGDSSNERILDSVAGDRDTPLATECERSEQIPPENDPSQTSDGDQQKKIFGNHDKSHHVIVRECDNCTILSETNEFCFNLLENKQGHRPGSYLETEKVVGDKGSMQYFGKALGNCSKCGNLQIHNLFTNNNENSSPRLNLGGFSPVILHNVFKTCESKGSDIECRLVILGARPRSSPAYAFLSDHSTTCSNFCQHCQNKPESPNRGQNQDTSYATHQIGDCYTTITDKNCAFHQSNAVSLGSYSQAPLVQHTIDNSVSSTLSTNHLLFPPPLQRIPNPQQAAVQGAHFIVKSPPFETPIGLGATSSQSGAQIMRGKSPPVLYIETNSYDTRKCDTPLRMGGELTGKNSPAAFVLGNAHFNEETTAISNLESMPVSSSKEGDVKMQNKRLLSVADENDSTPAKRYHLVCKVSGSQNVQGVNISSAINTTQSVTYTQLSGSDRVLKVDSENNDKPMLGTELTFVHGNLGSSNTTRLSTASQVSKDSTGETTTSGTGPLDPAPGEHHSKIVDVLPPQTCSPKSSTTPESKQGISSKSQNTASIQIIEKPSLNIADSVLGKDEKTDVSHWNNEDVMSFLKRVDCGEYADLFMQEDIDGQALLLLNEERLHSLLGVKMGPAMKIAKQIRKLLTTLGDETESTT